MRDSQNGLKMQASEKTGMQFSGRELVYMQGGPGFSFQHKKKKRRRKLNISRKTSLSK
jgi:hypothetical protein